MQYVNKLFESDVFKAVVNSKFFKVLGINYKKIQFFVRAAMQRYTFGNMLFELWVWNEKLCYLSL